MKSVRFAALISGILCALTASATRAAIIKFEANLDGPSESPPNASPGTGFAEVDFDTVANTMRVQVTFNGLLGITTASHIHSATPMPLGGTAIVATTTPSFTGFPLGVTAGTYDQTFNMLLDSSYNPAFEAANGGTAASAEAALLAGMQAEESYLNIHTTVVPGGEIRGFLIPVPEPRAFLLAALGALGVGAIVAVRRQRLGRSV
jgi:hypothetical protein